MRLAAALLALALAAPAAADDDAKNRLTWMLECQGCHRADGSATEGSVPAIAGQVSRFLHVPGGRDFLARVPGVANAPIDDATLAALLNWMLRRYDPEHLPNDFEPFTPDEIGRLRERPLGSEAAAQRARLLEAARTAGEP